MSNELAMCLTNKPEVLEIHDVALPARALATRAVTIKAGQRIYGQWINGLFYFSMSKSENIAITNIGNPADFGPIIEEPATA